MYNQKKIMIFASIKNWYICEILYDFFLPQKLFFRETLYIFQINIRAWLKRFNAFISRFMYPCCNEQHVWFFFSFIFHCLQNVCTMISFLSIILINKNIFLFFFFVSVYISRSKMKHMSVKYVTSNIRRYQWASTNLEVS